MESLELELGKESTKTNSISSTSRLERPSRHHPSELPKMFGRLPGNHQAEMLLLPSPLPTREERRAYLELEMRESQRAAFCNSMSSNYLNYLHQYELFCDDYSYEAFPLKEIVLSMFAQYLSKKRKPQLIKAVLSGIHTVATTAGYEVSQKQFPLVNITLWGLEKSRNFHQNKPTQ